MAFFADAATVEPVLARPVVGRVVLGFSAGRAARSPRGALAEVGEQERQQAICRFAPANLRVEHRREERPV